MSPYLFWYVMKENKITITLAQIFFTFPLGKIWDDNIIMNMLDLYHLFTCSVL